MLALLLGLLDGFPTHKMTDYCVSGMDYFLSGLTDQQVDLKLQALRCYHSQQMRRYFDPENVLALARVRGMQSKQAQINQYLNKKETK